MLDPLAIAPAPALVRRAGLRQRRLPFRSLAPAFGNRETQTATKGSAPQPNFSFSTTSNRIDGYCYDAAGNLLDEAACPSGSNHQFAYDGEGKLISSNYGATTYIYDGEGVRIGKSTAGTVTNLYFYDLAGRRVWDTDGSLNSQRTEIYAGGRHLATYNSGSLYYNLGNWLGTEESHSDASGNICEATTSLPFGETVQTTGSCSPTNALFTGKERDTESGNDYFGARYYASSMGRFVSPDHPLIDQHPENPQSWNLYAYARNNPLINIDPTGLG